MKEPKLRDLTTSSELTRKRPCPHFTRQQRLEMILGGIEDFDDEDKKEKVQTLARSVEIAELIFSPDFREGIDYDKLEVLLEELILIN